MSSFRGFVAVAADVLFSDNMVRSNRKIEWFWLIRKRCKKRLWILNSWFGVIVALIVCWQKSVRQGGRLSDPALRVFT